MQIFVCPAKWKIFVVLFVFNSCSQRTDASKQQSSPFAKKTKNHEGRNSYNKTVHILFDVFLTRLPQKKKTTKQEKRYFSRKKKLLERKDALMHTREKDKQVTKHCFPIFWKCVPVEYIYFLFNYLYILKGIV